MLRAPFPWFGGKSRAAALIWDRLGDVDNYVEPFAGSLAVLLGRPSTPRLETVNDIDCYVANFWRAIQMAPELVAVYANTPVNEADLHARHQWLVDHTEFRERMKVDPTYFDAQVAGWWAWGLSTWIGSGWCDLPATGDRRVGPKQIPKIGGGGQGVHRSGVVGNGQIFEWFDALAARLRMVRVCCGNWDRVLGAGIATTGHTGIVLDPPYSANREGGSVYANDDLNVAADVRAWAIENGANPQLRIALCGYEGEHPMPASWECVPWKAQGGYGGQRKDGTVNENGLLERVWFSPHCLKVGLHSLFDEVAS